MPTVQRAGRIAERAYFRFPTFIGDVRVQHNEDQGTLAAAFDLGRTYIAMIEAGFCLPSPALFDKLAERYAGSRLYPEWVEDVIKGTANGH